jgi:hypothetical protein
VHLHVAGDAADGILRAVQQVDLAVAVKVDRVIAHAAGQKLGQAERTGVGTLIVQRIAVLFAGHQQQILKLATEQFGTAGVVEGERR